jgi:hypothetical protein
MNNKKLKKAKLILLLITVYLILSKMKEIIQEHFFNKTMLEFKKSPEIIKILFSKIGDLTHLIFSLNHTS